LRRLRASRAALAAMLAWVVAAGLIGIPVLLA
jgi:hypothetical protein